MTVSHSDARSLDIYLQPAVIGGGLGDIEEVLAVGRRLQRAGWSLRLYRRKERPLPPSVDGPWGWPSIRRIHRLGARAPRAWTVTPWWGVSAFPDPDRSGPPGPWSVETADIERAYGPEQVVHLSLEEFARTLTSRQQTRERWREGGTAARKIAGRLEGRAAARDIQTFRAAYRKWRAFDRRNVLHLFTGFRPSLAFAREFPEAIQSGPLWPNGFHVQPRRVRRRDWIWYASPSTSDRLADELARAIPAPRPGVRPLDIEVRGPRRFPLPSSAGIRWRWVEPSSIQDWSRRFRSAELRIVTGSRTLLEALVAGGPFLYFNGVLNQGARTRRHRPEKIEALLAAWQRHGVSRTLRHDLADFSRLRRVTPIVQHALFDRRWATGFPRRSAAVDYTAAGSDGGRLIDRWVSEWARSDEPAPVFVRRIRSSTRIPRSRL